MKATKLVKELQYLINKYGDFPVTKIGAYIEMPVNKIHFECSSDWGKKVKRFILES